MVDMTNFFEFDYDDDEHPYYGALSTYDAAWVFRSFRNNEPLWTPLIDGRMYQKALLEFILYGEFIKFPVHHIYKWIGIIMKNTAILRATTSIAGHDQWFPEYDFIDAFFNDDMDEFEQYCNEHDYNSSDVYFVACEYLNEVGFYGKYCILPDGSDAWSDYGLNPIEKLLSEYSTDMKPEEVIVLINKVLDIYHCRGDLASAFIKGGTKTLSRISNNQLILEKIQNFNFNIVKTVG